MGGTQELPEKNDKNIKQRGQKANQPSQKHLHACHNKSTLNTTKMSYLISFNLMDTVSFSFDH